MVLVVLKQCQYYYNVQSIHNNTHLLLTVCESDINLFSCSFFSPVFDAFDIWTLPNIYVISSLFPMWHLKFIHAIIIIIICTLTTRVVGAPQMISQPFFSVLRCPLGPAELQACPFPDVVFPPLPLSALSSSPFHCALQDGFDQTWWTGDMTIPLQFASLYNHQEVKTYYHEVLEPHVTLSLQ